MNENLCNGCPHLMKILAPTSPLTYNFKCTCPTDAGLNVNGHLISYRENFNADITRPDWCPTKGVKKSSKTDSKTMVRKIDKWDIEKALRHFKPKVNINDLEEGDILHIPPFLGEDRYDAVIKKKWMFSLDCEVLGAEYLTTVHLYDTSLGLKFATKIGHIDKNANK